VKLAVALHYWVVMDPAAKSNSARRGRLLLVDDEENILRSIKRVLRHVDLEIFTAPDAEKGLELFQQHSPEVVVSDFRMPGMNGVEFLSRIKVLAPKAQRIMLTGQADQLALEEAINRSEVFRFIAKPWDDAQLVLTIKNAFEQVAIVAENDRLYQLTQEQNNELRLLNLGLEERVSQRTRLLQVAKREWEMSFDSIDLPLAIVQSDYTMRRANLAYSRAAHKPIQEVGTLPKCHQYLFNRADPCPGCPLKASLSNGEEGRGEISHQEKTYVLNTYPMTEEGQAVCSYRDVTEERVFTQRMVESEKKLAMGQLAGGVAHEVNNPLSGILAFAQLMSRDEGRTPKDLESLQLIEESALRCKRIVESLLTFSRRSGPEERRPVDLSKCIDDTLLLFSAKLKQLYKVTVQKNLASGLPPVHADATQVGQVLLNLLQNAVYALPEQKGSLEIETGLEGRHCFFKVVDSGTGIKQEHLSQIFEPHFTTKPPGDGTGLGLAIVQRIVREHSGEIRVDSHVGKTTFTVFLPAISNSLEKGVKS
jgi:two-component system, NtrC family, sensor kinase